MKNIYKILLLVSVFFQLTESSLKASTPLMLLRLEATGQSMSNETVVYFDSSGTMSYNYLYDAPSLGVSPGYLNIITRLDSIDFQIKCLPPIEGQVSVPVKVVTGVSGAYQIYINGLQNLPGGACITLYDNLTNNSFDLRQGAYSCNISDTESVARFQLNISVVSIPVFGNQLNPTCKNSNNGFITANSTGGNMFYNYYWKDSLNNIIKTSLHKNGPDTLFNLNPGFYKVDIGIDSTCNNGTNVFILQSTMPPMALYTTIADTLLLDNTGIQFTNASINAGNFWWDFGDGGGTNDTNALYNYSSPGTYTVTLSAFGSVCTDTSTYFKSITIVDSPLAIEKNTMKSNHLTIGRDVNGYYVQFNYATAVNAVISVSDLLGQKVCNDSKVDRVMNEKVSLNIIDNVSGALIISAVSTANESAHLKIIK